MGKLPKAVHKTIKDMHAQGVPKEVIADKIKLSAKDTSADKLVDGVLKSDPVQDKVARDAKKRQTKLKNEIRKQAKAERKNKFRREL